MRYDFVYDVEDKVKFVMDIVSPADVTYPFFSDDPNFSLALSLFADESQYPVGTDCAKATSPIFNVTTESSTVAIFYGDDWNEADILDLQERISRFIREYLPVD